MKKDKIVMNKMQTEIARHLKASTLTPAVYRPSDRVKANNHAAVFVDASPEILCGPGDDIPSLAQAEALANSPRVQAIFRASGKSGVMYSGIVAGGYVRWHDTESAVVSKHSGQVDVGTDDGPLEGPLIAIVLNDPDQAITACLCLDTAVAGILDQALNGSR